LNKIKKEFGQISGEELFKPITKRLDKAAKEPEPAEDPAGPDYEMDEFDRLNPFDGEFRPDDETPPPSPTPPAGPDYQMDEFDRLNPFDGEFRPDDETPPPTPPPTPSPTPPPLAEEESDDDDGDDGDEVQETTKRKAWETPVKPEPEMHESTDLGTIKQLITKYGDDPNYRVKSKTSKFQGYSV